MGPKHSEKDKTDQKARRRPGRVPTSCAECRRLKLRCDRSVPCETCVKRGCGAICPDGSLTTGKGNRLILANTEELHENIERLYSRIHDLEEALKALQAAVSDRPHPLLQNDPHTLQVPPIHKSPPTKPAPVPLLPRTEESRPEEEHILDAFGTLTIGSDGETSFLGKTALSEYLILAPSKPSPPTSPIFPRLSQRVVDAGCSEMDTPVDEDLARQVHELLPSLSDAVQLSEIYLQHGKYLFTPVPHAQLFDDILRPIYQADVNGCLKSVRWHHSISLAFSIFALGALLDPSRRPHSVEAKEYHHLSLVALRLSHPIREATLDSVQALLHMAHFLQLNDLGVASSGTTWAFVGFAVRLGTSIGLHLNGARWKLDDEIVQRRSRVFWELFVLDTWISFGFGRPPSINPAFVDCALPMDTDEAIHGGTQKEMGFHSWIWQYTRLLHSVMTTAFGAKIPPYLSILDLDRKIRDLPVPIYLRPVCDSCESPIPDSESPPELHMQRWWVLSGKEATLLNLHRSYFAHALRDQPNDLLKHRYGPSVMATYRSAYRLIQGLKLLPCKKVPHLLSRINLPWSHALAAAIVMCLLVTRAPGSSLTTSSLEELDNVTRLFEEFAPNCRAAASNLDSVRKLCRKAHEAVNHSQSHETTSLTHAELDRLSGRTHLISSAIPTTSSHQTMTESCTTSCANSPVNSPIAPSTSPDVFMFSQEAIENLHPTIIQDMKTFDGLSTSSLPPYHDIFDFPTEPFPHGMPDIQFPESQVFGFGGDAFSSQPSNGFSHSGFTPVLDPTWQSFVEQLGF